MKRSLFLLISLLLIVVNVYGQDTYGIIFNGKKTSDCTGFNQRFVKKSKEISFGVKREGDRLFLEVTDKNWLVSLFKNNLDGVAIDVIPKDHFECDVELPKTQVRGTLLKPVYKKLLNQRIKDNGTNRWRVLVGMVPNELRSKPLEFNILFLSNKTMCQYYNIYNLDSYPWDLLDMGIYFDTITYKNDIIQKSDAKEKTSYKKLNFVIPFEKNKSQYSAIDVKPIYDSLNLTDYDISKISINAYASVEGSTAVNKKLQSERGASIIKALKSYISNDIETDVSTSENWAAFFRDIQNSKFKDLSSLDKATIKKRLTGTTANELESILSNHRKGVVTIYLTKKIRFENLTSNQLVQRFNESLTKGDLENAQIIQRALFDKSLKSGNPEYINQLEIPEQFQYANLSNNRAVFGYYQDPRYALISKNKLLKILEYAPKNKKVRYNLAAIDLYMHRYNFEEIDINDLRKDIINLKKYGIPQILITRMILNLNIVKAEKLQRAKKYKEKDQAVSFIKKMYKNIPLSNKDYLSLAQFLTYYANVQSAKELLQPVVEKVDVNEDLLFYYVNLTIVNDFLVKQQDYRVILNNAYAQNPQRFCRLFNASTEEGVTFQLLSNEYLRLTYCESCK